MKKVFVFAVLVVALFLLANFALASATNWMLYMQADSPDGTNAGPSVQIGVKPLASDGYDIYDDPPITIGSASSSDMVVVNDNGYSRNFMSTASYTTYPGQQKRWGYHVAGLNNATGTIRFRFGTASTTALAVAPKTSQMTYYVKLVDGRGMNVLKPSWAPNAGRPWMNGEMLELPIPTTVSTWFGEIDLPLKKLSSNSFGNMMAEGYAFEFVQAPVPEPGSLLALGAGLIGLTGLIVRRRRG